MNRRHPTVRGVLAFTVAALVIATVAGCTGDRPEAAGGTQASSSGSTPTNCTTPNTGCACDEPGQAVMCGKVERMSGSYVSCSDGQRTCTPNRTWGACLGDGVATRTVLASGLHLAALADAATACTDPCDPYCKQYADTAPGVVLPADGGLAELDGAIGIVQTISDAGSSCTGLTPMADQTMVVTSLSPMTTTPPTLTYTTSLLPAGCDSVAPLWGIDRFDVGAVNSSGAFTHVVPIPAVVTVTSYVGSLTASAKATVTVNATDVSAAPVGYTGASFPAAGPYPSLEAAPTVLYPYDTTVFPLGLRAPLAMWKRAGAGAAKAVKVSLVFPSIGVPTFQWNGIIPEPATPSYQIPQVAWDAFGQTSAGLTGKLVIQRIDSANKLQAPVAVAIRFATANLRGRIYYSEYDTAGQGDVKVVLPYGTAGSSTAQLPVHAGGNCGVCHTMSGDGSKFITSYEVASPRGPALNRFGISNVLASGALQPLDVGPGGTGDTRGLAYAGLTRTGTFALLGNNWWGNVNGGPNATTPGGAGPKFKVYQLPTTAVPATDVSDTGFGGVGNAWGLGAAQMYTPSFSPDNTRLVFTNADAVGGAAARQGLSFWQFDEATKKFSNRTTFAKTTAAGNPTNRFIRWPAWELDSQSVLFMTSQTTNDDGFNWYAGMLPSGCCGGIRVRGEIWSVNSGGPLGVPAPTAPVALTKLNTGLGNPSPLATDDTNRSYQPTMLGTAVGGFRWTVLTSNRAYGNLLNTGAGALSTMTNKLWISAITDAPSAAIDRSNPPFMLPNQNLSSTYINERGFWALDACKPPDVPASVCQANDECCGAPATTACAVDTPLGSPPTRHCKTTTFAMCRNVGQSCTTSAQCCGAPGDSCVSGTCQTPPPLVSFGGGATFTRDYTATCATGQSVVWRFFDWETIFPASPGSSIAFAAQTAVTSPGLAGATSVPLATQTTTNVTWVGADVSVALAAAAPAQKSQSYLRISMTFTPTTDHTGTPLLTQWRQNYDCIDSE